MTLIINHSNTINAGYEKRDVISILLALHDAGYDLPAEAIQAWALGHVWRTQNANHLTDYCTQIKRGAGHGSGAPPPCAPTMSQSGAMSLSENK